MQYKKTVLFGPAKRVTHIVICGDVDLHLFDVDPDPTFYFDADLDPTFHF
jgi:hypothetical protein